MKNEKPFTEYTADELKHHKENRLPVWLATVGRRSVVQGHHIYSDLEEPSEKLLDESIERMRQKYWDTYILRKGQTLYDDSPDNGDDEPHGELQSTVDYQERDTGEYEPDPYDSDDSCAVILEETNG